MASEVPWFPRSLRKYADEAAELRRDWCYVVLEEIVDGLALLMRWPWPLADEKGRLRWLREDDLQVLEASVPVPVLTQQLYRPNHLQRRPRVGDTFAVPHDDGSRWRAMTPVTALTDLFPDQVIDVSADARVAAKLAFQGSLVTVLPKREVEAALVRQATADSGKLQARRLVTDAREPAEGGRR